MATKYCPKCNRIYAAAERFCPDDQEVLSLKDPYRLVGNTLMEKYRIMALIGMGGMGAVYCAHHLGIDRRVAFKILQPNIAVGDDYVVELFEREAKLAGRLTHENIVDVKDAGHTPDGIAYIVMEWLEGLTLDEKLSSQGHLSFKQAFDIIRQITAALGEAHAKHVVHRDLKPGNIMLIDMPDGRERVKVLDFGIGKVIEGTTANSPVSAILGTPQYASPEQLTVGGRIDGRSDIYSLGVIFYRLLGGQLPFRSSSMGELLQMQLTATPKPLREIRPEIPQAIEKLVNEMLAKDPSQRPQSADEIIKRLDQLAARLNIEKLDGLAISDASLAEEAETPKWDELDEQTTEDYQPFPSPRGSGDSYSKKADQYSTEQAGEVETRQFASRPQRQSKSYTLYGMAILLIVAGSYGLYHYLYGNSQDDARGWEEMALGSGKENPSPSPVLNTNQSVPTPSVSIGTTPKTSLNLSPIKQNARQANQIPTAAPVVNRAQTRLNQKQAAEHLERARALYRQSDYQNALRECNESLRLNPQQNEARKLKRRISDVLRILNSR